MNGLSDRLERLLGQESTDDCRGQSDRFLQFAVAEGLSDDRIVSLARKHKPTRERFEYDPDARVERQLGKIRASSAGPADTRVDWGNLLSAPDGPPQWCVPGLFECGESVALVGAAKAGKTLLALELSVALATGTNFLGRSMAPSGVLYLDYENQRRNLALLVRQLGASPEELGLLNYQLLPRFAPLNTEVGAGQVLELVDRDKPALVVLDTLQRVVIGDENSSETFRELYRHLLFPLRRRDVAVLRLDHVGKNGNEARGSSAKSDDVDHAWTLQKGKEGLLRFSRQVSRTGLGPGSYTLRREWNPLRHVVVDVAPDDDQEEAGTDPVDQLLSTMSELDLPLEWGRDKIKDALQVKGVPYKTDHLAEAIRQRKS